MDQHSGKAAIGYLRVSTAEQGDRGWGLEAQEKAIRDEAARRDWRLVALRSDVGISGKSLDRRPGLQAGLASLKAGEASVLVVAKLDRLSRSVIDFASVLEISRRERWHLVALDLGVDTTTAAGELVANVMAAVSQWERRAISERTKAGLAIKRDQGIQLGRPPQLGNAAYNRILELRGQGHSLQRIADSLNTEGVATAHGGSSWWPSTVAKILARAERAGSQQ